MNNFFHLFKMKFFSKTEKDIMRIALPAIFESLLTTFATMIDTKMVANLGSNAVSAVSITNQPRLFMMTIFFAISTVVSILVARYYGRNDKKSANSIFFTGFIASFVIGVTICGIVAACSRPIMSLFSSKHPELLDASSEYFFIVVIGSIFNALFLSINAGLRGCGYTHLTFICSLVSTIVNIFFNYLFIEGHWGAPRLEIKGAAIATALGFVCASIVSIAFAFKSKFFVNFKYVIKEKAYITKKAIKEIFLLWYKVLLENLLTRVGYLFSGFVIGLLPSSADISSYSIGMNFMNITLALGDGFSQSSIALVGKNTGAKNYQKVKDYSFSSLRLGIVLSSILVIVYACAGPNIYSFFIKSDDAFYTKIMELGRIASFIIAAVAPIQIIQIITNGILRGSGDVKYPLIAATISVTIINPIFAYLLAIVANLGGTGIWIATLISQATRMILLIVYMPNRFKQVKAQIENELLLESKKEINKE